MSATEWRIKVPQEIQKFLEKSIFFFEFWTQASKIVHTYEFHRYEVLSKPPGCSFGNYSHSTRHSLNPHISHASMAMIHEIILRNDLRSFVKITKLDGCFRKFIAVRFNQDSSLFLVSCGRAIQAIFISWNTFWFTLEVDLGCSKHRHPKPNLAKKCQRFVMGHKISFLSIVQNILESLSGHFPTAQNLIHLIQKKSQKFRESEW